jgi:hypothetical protein
MTTAAETAPALFSRAVDHIAIAVGTSKGMFVCSDGRLDGPFFPGERVPAMTVTRDRYLVATVSTHWGVAVHATQDSGLTWSDPQPPAVRFPPGTDACVARIWALHDDTHNTGVIYAGAEPAALFRSLDGGRSFELVRSLWDHPDRPRWERAGGVRGLHTVLTHPARPRRIVVAISAGGVYRSDDAGVSWQARNAGIRAPHLPDPAAACGHCVHKVAIDAGDPDVLWAQGHCGTYRSADAGDSWVEVGRAGGEGGLPSDFGFPIVAHQAWPGTAYVFPLESADYRCAAGGHCRVYRTTDSGKSWEALGHGLPPEAAHVTVLRDAFSAGTADPHVLSLGTRSGEIYASVDSGETWRLVARHLPPILTLRILD